MRLQLMIILVLALVLVVFTLQNPHPVQMHFVGWGSKEFPVMGVILVAILIGVIISSFLGLKTSKVLKKKIQGLKSEISDLKNRPPVAESDELKDKLQ
ncbi:MAG: LapA family protein [Planctomycetes bacterium]|nr:LapA family protein [Planctomycetota bacterium]